MTRGPAASGGLAVVSAFVVGAAVAALLSSRSEPAPALDGGPLAAPPAAFSVPRSDPLPNAAGATHWAPVLQATVARRRPSSDSAPVGSLRTRTDDGTTNVVVVEAESDVHGSLWVRVPLAALRNGTEGWVPRSALGGWSFVDTRLVIDRAHLTATLLRAQRIVFRTPIAIGAPDTPTPAGRFYILDRLSGFASPMYGPLAFGTNARSPTLTDWPRGGVVGIHGTDRPDLVPGRVSHGCIRLTNPAIIRLGALMPIGTPVTVK